MSTIKHDAGAHQFATELDGNRAELDYTIVGNVMTITHTRVPRPIEGRGVAAALMRTALTVAASEGWSLNPACSYAASYLAKHSLAVAKQHVDELLDEGLVVIPRE